jgi:hypothetical protein
MNDPFDYSATIAKAASRARGDRLGKLYQLCEQQKTVSTRKLWRLLEELRDSDQQDAIHFKALADRLKSMSQGET